MAEKPKLKGKPSLPNKSSSQSSGQPKPNSGGGKPPSKKVNQNGGGGNSNNPPSPWLNPDDEPKPDQTASFVEYLRWMRPADPQNPYKDATKTQILQMAMEGSKNYRDRLNKLNERTKLITKETFEVTCPWRIRVGGHRGPESILLPAFDAQGIPFIPSSTLRGVARTQAIREIMAEKNCKWEQAETDQRIYQHFGSLKADAANQAGKIVFLDAYPIAGKFNLEMDMANNIWSWKEGKPDYFPNPNPFLSLKETTFLIGLRLVSSESDQQLLKQAQDWLITGLANGAGSQINTGYGQLLKNSKQSPNNEFLKVEFALKGQLIHGYQRFTQWQQNDHGNWQMRGQAQAEVRPTAFKSMLRYWFRVFALGVIAPADVQTWEGKIFGAISPTQSHGYLQVRVFNSNISSSEQNNTPRKAWERLNKNSQLNQSEQDQMTGILHLSFSTEASKINTQSLDLLIKNLVWLAFNLGGIGQGARRPYHQRRSNPKKRGSTFTTKSINGLSATSKNIEDFKSDFQKYLLDFYKYLGELNNQVIDSNKLLELGEVSKSSWNEIADRSCKIVIVSGDQKNNKPYALALLHDRKFKLSDSKYDGNLCGLATRQSVKPSPVWIADLGDYQVVTIFGATASPRRDYLQSLNGAIQVFPFR